MSTGRFGDSQMMPAGVADVSNGVGYAVANDPYSTALQDFFGMPSNQTMVKAYNYFPRTNHTLPDAYEGRNMFLNDTIEGLILSDNEVYTSILLRWLFTDQINFTFNTFVFNQTLPTIVPHEGVSRLIQSSTESQSFTTQRHGLGFRMEGDFADTAQGAAQYTRNLIQISQACQELANYGVELALLNCKDYQREWSAQYRERGLTYEKILDAEAANFGACALESGRIEIMIEEARAVLTARRIVADAVLLWPQAKLHFAMTLNGTRTGYYRMGPNGVSNFEQGPDAFGMIRNIALFESREFDVNVGGPRAQPLERPVCVGEVYGMLFDSRRNDTLSLKDYKTSQRDIFLYDLPEDQYKRVSFRDAIDECDVFEADGGIRSEFWDFANELNEALGSTSTALSKQNPRRIPIFVVRNGEQYTVANRFGDLDPEVLTDDDIRQVLSTIPAGKTFDSSGNIIGSTPSNVTSIPAETSFASIPDWKVASISVLVPTRSPLYIGGFAGLVSGSLPLSESANAFMYADVDVSRGEVRESDSMRATSKLSAWLNATMSSVSGKDDEAFQTALDQRNAMLVDIIKSVSSSSAAGIIAVRGALVKAFEDNVSADGTYVSGRSFDRLKADVSRVRDAAATLRGTESDAVAGDLLIKALEDETANPFATAKTADGTHVTVNTDALRGSAHADAIARACSSFGDASLAMEGRVLLHGATVGGVVFSADTADAWSSAVTASAKTSAQKSAAQRTSNFVSAFKSAHADFERSVRSSLMASGALVDAAVLSGARRSNARATSSSSTRASEQTDMDSFLFGDGVMSVGRRQEEPVKRPSTYTATTKPHLALENYQARLATPEFLPILNLPITAKTIRNMLENNIHVPFNILLFRLWIQLRMYTGILMRSGYETGASVVGHTNFAMGAEVATKTITGNFTFYYNSLVWKEKAVMHLRNICPRGYDGGWNTKFIDNLQEELYSKPARSRGSLLSALIPITENSFVFPLNFVPNQRVITADGNQYAYKDRIDLFGSYSMASYYSRIHGLDDSQSASEINSRYADEYRVPNTIAYLGAHYVYNQQEAKFSSYKAGSGHLSGNRTGTGAKAVWNGTGGRLFPDQAKRVYVLS